MHSVHDAKPEVCHRRHTIFWSIQYALDFPQRLSTATQTTSSHPTAFCSTILQYFLITSSLKANDFMHLAWSGGIGHLSFVFLSQGPYPLMHTVRYLRSYRLVAL